MELNPSQSQAVHHQSGPLLIVAGAGTGKTTVITERIKHLIVDEKIDPLRIFAATFTQKAAEEMLSRLDVVMPLGYQEPWLGTFHALADKLLKTEGLEIGLNPTYKIMTTTDQWLFLKEHLSDLPLTYYKPLGNPNRFISAIIKFFSRLSDEDVQPVEFNAFVTKQHHSGPNESPEIDLERLQELAFAYQTYEQLKRDASVMDFGDLISNTLKLLRERPHILRQYQQHFSHILVDEFQDTNYAQYQLIKLLAPENNNPNLIVVGDDDQSIYKFRGASIANILEFKQDYPQAKTVVLTKNYRSSQPILDAAYKVITNNNPERLEVRLGLDKHLQSLKPLSETLAQSLSFPTLETEVDWTAHEIVRLVAQENLHYQDIAILVRANSSLESYASTLRRYGIPFQLVANRGLFDQDEIKNLIYFLRSIIDPGDSLALFALTQLPLFNLDPQLVFSALASAQRHSTTLYNQLRSEPNEKVTYLLATIDAFQRRAATQSVTQVLYQFVLDTGYVDLFLKQESLDNQLKIKNLNLFFNKLKQFEAINLNRSVVNFLATLDLWLEAGEDPGQAQIEDIDTVRLMTIHAAKGLEFKAVFVGSLIAGRFPSANRRDLIQVPENLIKATIPSGNIHIQEERRLFYVALTRAQQYLYLTHALDMGGLRPRIPSGFIAETGLTTQPVSQSPPTVPLVPAEVPPMVKVLKGGHYLIDRVSYSQLDTFTVCPLKYKYRYLLQIPGRPHHSLSFGRTIHATLHQFHRLEMQHKQPTLSDLLTLYQNNFIDEGYDSPQHKADRFQSGQEALTRYYAMYKDHLGQPVMLEQKFHISLDGVTLVGKIDRIEKNKAGEYEIVDYKTGVPKDQKAVDRDRQLTLYALAATEGLNIKPAALSLYFIEDSGTKLTTSRTPAQLEKARRQTLEQINELKTSTFPAKPSTHTCPYCEFNRICPFAKLK